MALLACSQKASHACKGKIEACVAKLWMCLPGRGLASTHRPQVMLLICISPHECPCSGHGPRGAESLSDVVCHHITMFAPSHKHWIMLCMRPSQGSALIRASVEVCRCLPDPLQCDEAARC